MFSDFSFNIPKVERLTQNEKVKDDFKWYKDKAKWVFNNALQPNSSEIQINYDLMSNKINETDFKHLTNPFDSKTFKLPAKLTHRDIITGKIKVLQGMEMRRPFVWKVVATNSEATTRKEQEYSNRIRNFVVNSIMNPITQQINQQYQQQIEELSKDKNNPQAQQQIQEIQSKIQEEIKIQTPEEVLKYMEREHQDPLEVMTNQILEYLIQEKDIQRKFNKGWYHNMVSGYEVYELVIKNNEPQVEVLNPLFFRWIKGADTEFFEDGEAAIYEYDWSFNQIATFFGKELTDKEIDELKTKSFGSGYYNSKDQRLLIDWNKPDKNTRQNIGIRVYRAVWKGLRSVPILTYLDESGEENEMLVDDSYELNIENGDIKIENEWLPEVYETYILPGNIFKRMRPVPGQFRDINRLYECKLPFRGGICEDINTDSISIVGRAKLWNYMYNVIWWRIDLLMASDKGKKILMNINSVPSDSGIDVKMWQEYFESTPYAWFDPNEEGMEGYQDVNMIAKVIDMSLVSQINDYIKLAQEIKFECGESLGISRQTEGQIQERDSVYGTKTAVQQSATLLEPYFNFHDIIKKNVLTGLIELAKVAFEDTKGKTLQYVLDDESVKMFTIDGALMSNASMGLYIQNSLEIETIKDTVKQLAHAALQNQQMKMSSIISIFKEKNLTVMEENLKVSEKKMEEQLMQSQQQQQQHEKEMQQLLEQSKERDFEKQKELIILKGEVDLRNKTAEAAMTAASYNPDTDKDNDGVNDFVEMAKKIADTKLKENQLELEKEKFEHKKEIDNKKIEIDKKKVENQNVKKSL